MGTQTVSIDNVRTLAFGSIAATYNAVGVPLANAVRLICFTNNTDGDMYFSTDGVNDKLFIAAGSFKLFDVTTNRFNHDQQWVFAAGTQFSVRYTTAPTKGGIFIECLWGQ